MESLVFLVLSCRFRISSSELGGGTHSISHNAIVACLRLDLPHLALDLLMNKVCGCMVFPHKGWR